MYLPLIISMTSSWVFPITVMPFTYHRKFIHTNIHIHSVYVYNYVTVKEFLHMYLHFQTR